VLDGIGGLKLPIGQSGTANTPGRSYGMTDDDDITELAASLITVPETNRLYRLTPAAHDLSRPSRQIALVPAETEEDARRMATMADPMGRDWRNAASVVADSMETQERHVVGDVVFRSTPNLKAITKRKAR
jgi:hypothetical protein